MEPAADSSQHCWNPNACPGPRVSRTDLHAIPPLGPSAHVCPHRGLRHSERVRVKGGHYDLRFWGEETNFKIYHDNDSNIGKSPYSLGAYSVLGRLWGSALPFKFK